MESHLVTMITYRFLESHNVLAKKTIFLDQITHFLSALVWIDAYVHRQSLMITANYHHFLIKLLSEIPNYQKFGGKVSIVIGQQLILHLLLRLSNLELFQILINFFLGYRFHLFSSCPNVKYFMFC